MIDNVARDNYYSGFYICNGSHNILLNNTAINNGFERNYLGSVYSAFHLCNASNNTLIGNVAKYNEAPSIRLQSSSYNVITNNTIIILWPWYGGVGLDNSSTGNTIEDNEVITTGPSTLVAMLFTAYVSLHVHQQNTLPFSNLILAASLVAATVAAVAFRMKGKWRVPSGAFTLGAVGGVIGATAATTGIAWATTTNTLIAELNTYVAYVTDFLTVTLSSWAGIYRPYHGYPGFPLVVPVYPSFWLFTVLSAVLSATFVAAGVLISVGLYGYGVIERVVGPVRVALIVAGATLGGLLIPAGALTTGSTYARILMIMTMVPVLPVAAPNFSFVWLGFVLLGFTALLIGSTGLSLYSLAPKPLVSNAAGLLSILGGALLICNVIWRLLLFASLALMLVSFILWTVVFFSSKRIYPKGGLGSGEERRKSMVDGAFL